MRRYAVMAVAVAVVVAAGVARPSPRAGVDLSAWLEARPHAAAGSGADVAPSLDQAAAFAASLAALLDGRIVGAEAAAATIGYQVTALGGFVALHDDSGVGPTVVLAAAPWRDLVVEAPHSASEAGTAAHAAAMLVRLGARAAILEGAHRCASAEPSGCDGVTAVCAGPGGADEPFRASDVAHARASLFQVAHEALAARFPTALVVQLHRMRPDPTLVVAADGSGEARPGDASLPARVRDRVRAALGGDLVTAVSCHDPADDAIPYPALCATTNVQGRWLDGSGDACGLPGTGASGRFLHLEQGPAILDAAEPGSVVTDALGDELPLLPATPSDAGPVGTPDAAVARPDAAGGDPAGGDPAGGCVIAPGAARR